MMNRNFKFMSAAAAIIMGAMISIGPAGAQLDNKPFSFRTPAGGPGMSYGGKQAIINEKIFDASPDNLQRGPNGILLDVTKGPGRSAIVGYEGNAGFIPGFRGTDFRGGDPYMRAGIFNSYFSPLYNGNAYSIYDDFQTTAVIDTWTTAVISGSMPFSYYNTNSSIDSWTLFVHGLRGY